MYRLQRKLYSQNFLRSRKLTSHLVKGSSINKNDLVLEIGPGEGIITEQLVQKAKHVIAVEIDHTLYKGLQVKFRHVRNLTLYLNNFLNFPLPKVPHKVFANVPFSIEGKIIRKLIDAKNPPEDTYLVIRTKLAYRLSGHHKENQFSVLHKPWFDFSIFHHFRQTDFIPATKVKSAVLRFKKREVPLIPWKELGNYRNFIQVGFGQGMSVAHNIRKRLGYKKSMRILYNARIDNKAKPGYLNLEQWIGLYTEFKNFL